MGDKDNSNDLSQPIDSLLNHKCTDDTNVTDHNLDKAEHRDGRSRADKRSQGAKWLRILYDYSQSTTFHGICHVTAQQPFWIRRFLWLLLFLGGCIVFGIQVVTSVMYYLSWPVSVDVKINYNDTVVFPAVTFCNQNAFRTTQAYQSEQYYLINELFAANHANNQSNQWTNNVSAHLSLEDLYLGNGHRLEDLVVGCTWDGRNCDLSNFIPTLTDFGLCYTFNSGRDAKPLFHASQTGSEGGLRLQLNIEQYEYMKGPNPGAGLKLQIHNQDDISMVKDHGIAVPPGSHGFVAIKSVEVNNLKHPHGKCNDSVGLQYFDTYTMSSCYTNCKERFIVQRCGCRDVYMPNPNNDTPVCTIQKYQECLLTSVEEFASTENICECPIPCHRLLFDPTMSYASTSNFDIDALLRDTERTSALQKKYVAAQETQQRVNPGVISEDTRLIHSLNHTMTSLITAVTQLTAGLNSSHHQLAHMYAQLNQRIHFHLDRGLEEVKYAMEHDFVRGFDVFEERAFEFVCFDFYGFAASVKRTIQDFNATLAMDRGFRELLYAPLQDMLNGKIALILRADGYANETRNAYVTNEPLLTFYQTKGRRYDMSYISKEIVQSGIEDEADNYEQIMLGSTWLKEAIGYLKEIGKGFVETGSFNDTLYEEAETKFIAGCRRYNYRLFMYRTRVVEKPVEVCTELVDDFKRTNRSFQAAYSTTIRKMNDCKSLLTRIHYHYLNDILDISTNASDYLEDQSKLKTPLCKSAGRMDDTIRQLIVSFGELRSIIRELLDSLYELQSTSVAVWRGMLGETATRRIYEHLYNDSVTFLEDEQQYEFFFEIFASMLRLEDDDVDSLRSYTRLEIVKKINGDLHELVLDDVVDGLNRMFTDISMALNISHTVGDKDEQLLASFESLRTSLRQFQTGNEINSKFYRENFMRLDVFMQELSYEEITQQQAYDIPRLLSDIGGSMGLFIGGSVLSVFEVLDVFAHNGARMALQR